MLIFFQQAQENISALIRMAPFIKKNKLYQQEAYI